MQRFVTAVLFVVLCVEDDGVQSFSVPQRQFHERVRVSDRHEAVKILPSKIIDSRLWAAKKKSPKSSSGKGFGSPPATPSPDLPPVETEDIESKPSSSPEYSPLTSVESSSPPKTKSQLMADSLVAPSEKELADQKISEILREKYGMDGRDGTLDETVQRVRQKIRQDADEIDDFDLFKILPGPVLKGIDTFLKVGLAISSALFVVGGLAITLEAFSATTSQALPEDIDKIIVEFIEPNFTPGLFVLLGFSVSLGLFASAQLGSQSSYYSEDP